MSTLGAVRYESLINDYRAKADEFTLHAACGRPYVLITKLTQWLRTRDGSDHKITPASRLLKAAYDRRHEHEPIPLSYDSLKPGGDSCLLVFCILLLLDFGHLVHFFQREGKVDTILPIPLLTLRTILEEYGRRVSMPEDAADQLASQFNEMQWRFCPAIFELSYPRNFGKDRVLPFCVKEVINTKGRTASLWQVEVLEEFVGPQLRKKVLNSRYKADGKDDLGYRYQFALKTFEEGHRKTYENEKKAFIRLREHKGMVRCLTEFELKVQSQQDTVFGTTRLGGATQVKLKSTYNILLEFGECDLEEYFAQRLPPVFEQEIQLFWKGLFAVADALEGIHNLKDKSSGIVEEFHGWHADIKPENILSVQKKFKLADPGFAKFIRKKHENPTAPVTGGTESYGAPERYSTGHQAKVTQKIDTWSLGCVFSIAATWVVLGRQGIGQFSILRQKAFEKATEAQDAGDYFHDGKDILPEIKSWHEVLRSATRKTDTITEQVLKLVDDEMLIGNTEHRINAESLCMRLKSICIQIDEGANEAKAQNPMPKSVMEALLIVDKEAPARFSEEPMPERGRLAADMNSNDLRRDRSRAGIKLMKTSHRSETLESTLGSQSEEERSLDSSRNSRDEFEPPRPESQADAGLGISNSDSLPTDQNHHLEGDVPSTEPYLQAHRRTLSDTRYQTISEASEELQSRIWTFANVQIKKPPIDQLLARHFNGRDLLFVVDNGETMKDFWEDVKKVLETLLLKSRGLDDDGMDLLFTSGPCHVDRHFGERRFMKAMDGYSAVPLEGMRTDMAKKLQEILSNYLRHEKLSSSAIKDLTIIVLTDGLWQGTLDKDQVRRVVIDFCNELEKVRGKGIRLQRPVSIEFIQFGRDNDATERLRSLDDDLEWEGCQDIIDTEHSTGNIYKMLLGSFVPGWDAEDEFVSPTSPAANPTASPTDNPASKSPPTPTPTRHRILRRNNVFKNTSSSPSIPTSHHAPVPFWQRRVRTDQGTYNNQTPPRLEGRYRASSSIQDDKHHNP